MANTCIIGAYTTDVAATQRLFYGQSPSFGYQMLLSLSTQLFGYCLAGWLRRFVVWPSSMIWPGILVNAALFNTFHNVQPVSDGGRMSRLKFFCIILACSFIWYWVPGYLWTGLSVFNWVCWIAPNNVVVNELFGSVTGLGWGLITFDWAMISFVGSPLVTPVCPFECYSIHLLISSPFQWWAEANILASLVISHWIIGPIVHCLLLGFIL
jgi:OPT oligopeptide transporter protein